jgi:Fe-S cluster assembly iron-binding protein IscA
MSQEVQHDEQGHEHGHEGARDNAAASAQGINLTPKALEMVKQMHMKEGLGAEQGLRISVVGGGCSGFQYSLSFDAHKEGDTEQEIDGTTLDYVEGLHAGGFRFDNPRASRTCGCGSSFSA